MDLTVRNWQHSTIPWILRQLMLVPSAVALLHARHIFHLSFITDSVYVCDVSPDVLAPFAIQGGREKRPSQCRPGPQRAN
jgi:hypothetical protein